MNGPSIGRRRSTPAEPVDLLPVQPGATVAPLAPPRDDARPPGRLPARWYAVPLVVVVAAAMAHGLMDEDDGHPGETVPRGAGGDERAPPGWERGSIGPLPSRIGHVSSWTGSELVVWGGDSAADGAAYNPSTGTWRRVRPAPFPAAAGAASAWTGIELLVWGGESGGPRATVRDSGGAYDVAADRWRSLPPAPLSARRPLAATWTGESFVVVGGSDADGRPLVDGAAYEPKADRWAPIAAVPIPFRQAVAVWTGQEVVLIGTSDPEPGQVAAVAWHPASDQWKILPGPPLTGRRVTAVWTGRELVAWDDTLRSAALEVVTGEWRRLPDIPSVPGFCDPAGVLAGDVVFAETCGRGAIYDPAAGRWSATTHPYFLSGQPVWTGRRLLWWTGSFRGSKDSIWIFTPGHAAAPADAAPGPAAPEGVEACAIAVSGRTGPARVRAGEDFVWLVSVTNTSRCRFSGLGVNAFISPTRQVRYWLVAQNPPATERMLHSFSAEGVDTGVLWPEAGPLAPGEVRRFAVRGRIAPTAAPGRIEDDVDVTARVDTRDVAGHVTLRVTVSR